MKKVFAFLMMCLFVFSMSGCGGGPVDGTVTKEDGEQVQPGTMGARHADEDEAPATEEAPPAQQ